MFTDLSPPRKAITLFNSALIVLFFATNVGMCLFPEVGRAQPQKEKIHGKVQVLVVDLFSGPEYETFVLVHGKHRQLTLHGKSRTKTPLAHPGAIITVEGNAIDANTLDIEAPLVTPEPILDPYRNRGPKRFAYVPVWTPTNPLTLDTSAMRDAIEATTRPVLEGSSYGRMQPAFDILPQRELSGGLCNLDTSIAEALNAECSRDWTAYQYVQILNSRNCDWTGLGSMGTWTVSACSTTYDLGVSIVTTRLGLPYAAGASAHEFGHNFGLHHDGSYVGCGPSDLGTNIGSCTKIEYGDWAGTMGNSMGWGLFESAQSRAGGWLEPGEWVDVSVSGTYTLTPVGSRNSGAKVLSISRGANTNAKMYLSFKSPTIPQDAGVPARVGNGSKLFGGLLVHVSDTGYPSGIKPLLIDTTPGVPPGAIPSSYDPILLPNVPLIDAGTGTQITLLAINDTTASVQVLLGSTTPSTTLSTTSTTSSTSSTGTIAPPSTTSTSLPCTSGGQHPPIIAGVPLCSRCCSQLCDRAGLCRLPQPLCVKSRGPCTADWNCCKRRCGTNKRCRP